MFKMPSKFLAGVIFLAILQISSPVYAAGYLENLSDWPVMSLQDALQRGLDKNLNLRIEALNVPISYENMTAADADFDPILDAVTSAGMERTSTSTVLADEPFTSQRSYEGEIGIQKKFRFGLDGRFSYRASRISLNSTDATLSPAYRSFLALDLTQPLLRDFGTDVTTTDLRIAENSQQQSVYRTLRQTQTLAAEIETTYYEVAQAIEIYHYRLESRQLAERLLAGNQEKFDAGLIPISEVQETETAVASRDEQVLSARQQFETAGNRLKDLLEINRDDPLSRKTYRTDPLPEIDQTFFSLEETLPIALSSRPDLAQQRLEIDKRDIRLQFSKNQTLLRLDLEATLGLNGLSGDDNVTTTAGNRLSGEYFDSVDRLAEGDGYQWFAGLRLTIPLGNREKKANYRRSGLEKRQAVYALKRLETNIETELIDGQIAVNRSLERVNVASRFESLAETTLNQEMERLREGLSDSFRILDFQDNVIEARIRKVTALTDYNLGLARLHRDMGTNLERLNILYKVKTLRTDDETY